MTANRQVLRFAAFFFPAIFFSAGLRAAPVAKPKTDALELKLLRTARSFFSPGAELSLGQFHVPRGIPAKAEIQILSPQPPLGMTSFECVWTEANRWHRELGTAVIRVAAPVAAAKKNISHGESFTPDNVVFAKRELTAFGGTGYYLELADLIGLRARGYVTPGAVLSRSNTEAAKAVTAGQIIDLVRRRGDLTITVRVKALETGNLDQWIRVQNIASGKALSAQVSGLGVVKLR